MPGDQSNDASKKEIAVALAAGALGAAGTAVVISAIQKWAGKSYSEKNIARLSNLSHEFKRRLQRKEAPQFWDLTNPHLPFGPGGWDSWIQELRDGREAATKFHTQKEAIVEHIETYLSERRKRWVGKGFHGDPIDLFMAEWLNFALTELPTYEYDDESRAKLDRRLAYLAAVDEHVNIFQIGWVTRRHNKFRVIDGIRQQLRECCRLAEIEALSACTRDSLSVMRAKMEELLLCGVKTLYYLRATPVHKVVLDLGAFAQIESDSAIKDKQAEVDYKKLRDKTHTGAMLCEVIRFAGLEVFGKPTEPKKDASQQEKEADPVYFDADFFPKKIVWQIEKADLPVWMSKKPQDVAKSMGKYQRLGESLLRLARLKKLVDDAFKLAGLCGDLWACGDKRGKQSLLGLLKLLSREIATFKERYTLLYHDQQGCKEAYFRDVQRLEASADVCLNFAKVGKQKDKTVDKVLPALTATVNKLNEKIAAFSKDDIRNASKDKEDFYDHVTQYMNKYHPGCADEFEDLAKKPTREQELAAFHLDEPLLQEERVRVGTVRAFFSKWFPEQSFAAWRAEYYVRFQGEYKKLAEALLDFDKQLEPPLSGRQLPLAAAAVQKQLENMKQQAEAERPKWGWGWFYIRAGWPFKRSLNKQYGHLLAEFNRLAEDVNDSLAEAKRPSPRAEEKEADESPRDQVEVKASLLVRAPALSKAVNQRCYYQGTKLTLFHALHPAPRGPAEEKTAALRLPPRAKIKAEMLNRERKDDQTILLDNAKRTQDHDISRGSRLAL